jgi:biotin operon repressor/anti-sigma regulatory factor (Ser/Thr protein kinase)
MAEWLKAAVSKTAVGVTPPGVRIPLSPPVLPRHSDASPWMDFWLLLNGDPAPDRIPATHCNRASWGVDSFPALVDNMSLYVVDNKLTIQIIMSTSTSDETLDALRKLGAVSGQRLADHLGISRQAVNRRLKTLVAEGRVTKRGATRGALYVPAGRADRSAGPRALTKTYSLAGLAEDRVFRDLSNILSLDRSLGAKAQTILRYAFTEILNNAIEHSQSKRCLVTMSVGPYACVFRIRDYGIGIFHSISSQLGLPDEETALGELLKGKTTTMKDRHSGEGIFFVSKAADSLDIRSHRILLRFDNTRKDIEVEQARMARGTDVRFSISNRSRRDLTALFAQYSPQEFDYQFQRTRVLVRLYLKEYVSRSEARRLLSGLEKFREVVLDMSRVRRLGQGFADEVFRVFPSQNPGITLKTENVAPVVRQMVRHVVDNPRSVSG